MSYDLFFTSPAISLEEFNSYFSLNPLYELKGGEAFYSNDATGVYFFFRHEAGYEEDNDINAEASFNLNYFRPHFFGLEASIEVERFVSHFNCEIEDPQTEGMGSDAFTVEGFLKGWNAGNQFAIKAILNNPTNSAKPNSLPTKKLEEMWKWNYSIEAKNDVGEDIFIPKLFFVKANGVLGTCAVWPDAIPTFVPDADFLHVPRKDHAPRKHFLKQKVEDTCLLAKKDFPSFFFEHTVTDTEISAYKLPFPATPKYIKKYVSELTAFNGDIEGIAIDSVLNEELVAKL